MTTGEVRVSQLTRDQCWELLASRSVSRLVWSRHDLPQIRPVNHRVVGQHLLLQSAPGGWHEQVDGRVVALEADDVDEWTRAGRSVVVRGTARVLGPGSDGLRALQAGAVSWLDGRSTAVLVTPAELSGRWLLPVGS